MRDLEVIFIVEATGSVDVTNIQAKLTPLMCRSIHSLTKMSATLEGPKKHLDEASTRRKFASKLILESMGRCEANKNSGNVAAEQLRVSRPEFWVFWNGRN
jgi:hypothetical protein